MQMNEKKTSIIWLRVLLGILCLGVAAIFIRSYYVKSKLKDIDIKSRYTFSVEVDAYGNALGKSSLAGTQVQDDSNITNIVPTISELSIEKVADTWVTEYVNQFMNPYLPSTKSVKKMNLDSVTVLDEDNNTVLISFNVVLKNSSTDYFASWDGVTDNGKLKCEWVVSFYIDDHNDNTATVYVSSMLSSEEYGIAKYNEQSGIMASKENTTNTATDLLADYIIKDSTLSVTYDAGGKYVTVPVDVENLHFESGSTSKLKEGSFTITTNMTAFIYGGKTVDNKKIPLTIMYSSDKGLNWTTCELDSIYNASDFYVDFFDEKNGVVVCGYGKTDNENESSRIYSTSDGGNSWTTVGNGPANYILKGVVYIDQNVGFFCYDYVQGMDSNLYITKDGGKTFSKVNLPEQELDSTAKAQISSSGTIGIDQLKWSDVYKEALVPVVDDKGVISIYLTQGKNGTYNEGKTAAKYQSTDKGNTWTYLSQLEITTK
ncbi:MAG: exo-alpha-sialidase [Eubacteriales bacterium]|nr:exo-alpha-sialidase [Eubacteriales bacterium]